MAPCHGPWGRGVPEGFQVTVLEMLGRGVVPDNPENHGQVAIVALFPARVNPRQHDAPDQRDGHKPNHQSRSGPVLDPSQDRFWYTFGDSCPRNVKP